MARYTGDYQIQAWLKINQQPCSDQGAAVCIQAVSKAQTIILSVHQEELKDSTGSSSTAMQRTASMLHSKNQHLRSYNAGCNLVKNDDVILVKHWHSAAASPPLQKGLAYFQLCSALLQQKDPNGFHTASPQLLVADYFSDLGVVHIEPWGHASHAPPRAGGRTCTRSRRPLPLWRIKQS